MELITAYIAGFFDGEGCISSQEYYEIGKYEKYPRITMQISVTNTDKEILNFIRGVFGGIITKHSKPAKQKQCYSWKLTGKDKMLRFLNTVLPYVMVKKEDVELGIQLANTLRSENLGCSPLDHSIHMKRLEIHNKLRKRKDPHVPHIRNGMKQSSKIAGNSRTDNPQGSPGNGEPSTTIMEPSERMMG